MAEDPPKSGPRYKFRSSGADSVRCVTEEIDILDEPQEKVIFAGTLTEARAWAADLAQAIQDCETLEARRRAERRTRLEAEIAERLAEIAELARIDGVPPAPAPQTPPRHAGLPVPPADPSIPPPEAPRFVQTYSDGQADSRPC